MNEKEKLVEEIKEMKAFIEHHHLKSVFKEWQKKEAEREGANAEADL